MEGRKGWCEVVTFPPSRKTTDSSKSLRNMARKTGASSLKNYRLARHSKERANSAAKGIFPLT